jgi:hypothetical protein
VSVRISSLGWIVTDDEYREFQRFREREPLVQSLVIALGTTAGTLVQAHNFVREAKTIRDFKLVDGTRCSEVTDQAEVKL